MRAKALILENFRSYKTRTTIPLSKLTAFVGRNDAGKSSILEALDIFFEGGTVKIDRSDANVYSENRDVRIGVIFDELPSEVVLDSNATTTLENEYLLNSENRLEIHKVFNCALATPKATVYAIATHPSHAEFSEILQKNQTDLRRIVRDRELQNSCNLGENPSMRHAIYQCADDLALRPDSQVPLNEHNGKAIWTALQKYLPLFALFQSDRPSSDQDPEVQNPMKVAIDRALSDLEHELEEIAERVREQASATATATLEKLQENYSELATELTPKFRKPSWKSLFKLDLEADDGIPLNKRGSGVRRLVLLSFFQAEAEKDRGDAERRIIYAIEEPETSQHPDHLLKIIESLQALSERGDQVLITTHVPGLAELVPLPSLRFVDSDNTAERRVRMGAEGVYDEIAQALGILPEPPSSTRIAVAVLVEGKNDIDALHNFARTLTASGHIHEIDDERVFWTIGGGEETLKDWIERSYLDKLNVPQVIIRDSDRSAPEMPLSQEKQQWLTRMSEDANKRCFVTRKRNMDNYLHHATVMRLTDNRVDLSEELDLDYVRIDQEFGSRLRHAIQTHRIEFRPVDINGSAIRVRKQNSKKIINAYIMAQMTSAEILERSRYEEDGEERCEVSGWLNAILEFC